MADIKFSAYRGVSNVLNTGATLASAAMAVSSNYDNGTNLDLWCDVELSVTFSVAPAAGAVVELYLLPSIDAGTTHPDQAAAGDVQAELFVGYFTVRAVTSAQVRVNRFVPLAPGIQRFAIKNTAGQTMASGWTLDINPYRQQSV